MSKPPAKKIKIVPSTSKLLKESVEVELIFHDGSRLSGMIFIGPEQRVQDMLNAPEPFFPLQQDNAEIVLVGKGSLALCKPLDTPG